MSWAVLGAGALTGGGMALGGLFGGGNGGGGGYSSQTYDLSPEQKELIKFQLNALKKAQNVKYPLQGIEPLNDIQLAAIGRGSEFSMSQIPELNEALQIAMQTARDPVDLSQIPEFRAVQDIAGEQSSLLSQANLRALQGAGGLSGGQAADIMGRSVQQGVRGSTAALAPFAESAANRRFNALGQVSALTGAQSQEEMARFGAGLSVGGVSQGAGQDILNALYNQSYQQSTLPLQVAGLASGYQFPGPTTVAQPRAQSTMFSDIAGLLGSVLPGLMRPQQPVQPSQGAGFPQYAQGLGNQWLM